MRNDIREAVDSLVHAATLYTRILMTCETGYEGLQAIRRAEYDMKQAKDTLLILFDRVEREAQEVREAAKS